MERLWLAWGFVSTQNKVSSVNSKENIFLLRDGESEAEGTEKASPGLHTKSTVWNGSHKCDLLR